MSNKSQSDFEDWGLILPQNRRKIEEGWDWSIDLGNLYWQEIIDRLEVLNKNNGVIYRLPTANELLVAYSERVEGFIQSVYWSSTIGLDTRSGGLLDLIAPFPTVLSEDYSTIIDFQNGNCYTQMKGVSEYIGKAYKYVTIDKRGCTMTYRYWARLLKKA